jgi:alpha,alpha-trehalase
VRRDPKDRPARNGNGHGATNGRGPGAPSNGASANGRASGAEPTALREEAPWRTRSAKELRPRATLSRTTLVLPEPSLGPPSGFAVKPRELLFHLLQKMDVGRDGKITVDDLRRARVKSLNLELAPGLELRLSGAERLSGLAAVLGREIRRGNADHALLPLAALAPTRLDRMLSYVAHTWRGLVRRADHVDALCHAIDEGILRAADGRYYLYVPEGHEAAIARLRRQAKGRRDIEIVAFPRKRGRAWQKRMEQQAGIAFLPRPYLVPGGMFTEMYGWDCYFQARGALGAGYVDIARDVAENLAYQIRHFGKIANTNRSYHLSRTQPPLFTPLARQVFEELERRGDPEALEFLKRCARAAERSSEQLWGRAPRATPIGLARYHDEADGPCPEVDPRFYDQHPRTPDFFANDRAQRESGWDLTHRFGEEAHQAVPVCLNALLYRQERDLAAMYRRIDGARSARAARWDRRAKSRRALVDHYLWDPQRGQYFDWSLTRHRRSHYESLATFFPLWVGMASGAQAARVAEQTERFMEAGGLATTTADSRRAAPRERFQWDWPVGWAPLQVIAVEGLRRYGFQALADKVAYRWLHMVMRIAGERNGTIKEKYDVVEATHDVDAAEYHNQGNDLGVYLAAEENRGMGFGWSNASVPLLLQDLEGDLRAALENGIRPSTLGL